MNLNLTALHSSLENLKNLEELNLQGKRLINLPEMLFILNYLREINISDNPVNNKKDNSIIQ